MTSSGPSKGESSLDTNSSRKRKRNASDDGPYPRPELPQSEPGSLINPDMVTLFAEDSTKPFLVHKDFVVAASPVLKAAFSGNFQEAQEQVYKFEEVSERLLSRLCSWFNIGSCCIASTAPDFDLVMTQLWVLADRLLMPDLQNEVVWRMSARYKKTKLPPVETTRYMWTNTMQNSPLRKFFLWMLANSGKSVSFSNSALHYFTTEILAEISAYSAKHKFCDNVNEVYLVKLFSVPSQHEPPYLRERSKPHLNDSSKVVGLFAEGSEKEFVVHMCYLLARTKSIPVDSKAETTIWHCIPRATTNTIRSLIEFCYTARVNIEAIEKFNYIHGRTNQCDVLSELLILWQVGEDLKIPELQNKTMIQIHDLMLSPKHWPPRLLKQVYEISSPESLLRKYFVDYFVSEGSDEFFADFKGYSDRFPRAMMIDIVALMGVKRDVRISQSFKIRNLMLNGEYKVACKSTKS